MTSSYERKMIKKLDEITEAAESEKEARRIAAQTLEEYKAEKKKQGENK